MILSQPMLTVTVPGQPVPQGSLIPVWPRNGARCPACKRGLGRSLLIPGNDRKLRPWRKQVTAAAKTAILDARAAGSKASWPLTGPVWIRLDFAFTRPASHAAGSWPTGKGAVGDLDKLVRAVYDSCTGVIYGDDAQVVMERTTKAYAASPGVRIIAGVVIE